MYVFILPVNYYSESTIVTAHLNKGVLKPQMYLCVTRKCEHYSGQAVPIVRKKVLNIVNIVFIEDY